MGKRTSKVFWAVIAGTVIIVISLFIFQNSKIKILQESIESIITEIDSLQNRYNDLVKDELKLAFLVSQNKLDAEKIISILQENLVDADISYLLKSSVMVRGFEGMGSGTVIKMADNEIYILSCYHVVSDIIRYNKMGLPFGVKVGYLKRDIQNLIAGYVYYEADIIKYDEEKDLVLLKLRVNDNELNAVNVSINEPEIGDIVYSIGNPIGVIRTVSKGILSNKVEGFYVSDNTTTFGNSGGGLYNIKNELIGIPAQVLVYGEKETIIVPESSLGFSITLPIIRDFLQDTGVIDGK